LVESGLTVALGALILGHSHHTEDSNGCSESASTQSNEPEVKSKGSRNGGRGGEGGSISGEVYVAKNAQEVVLSHLAVLALSAQTNGRLAAALASSPRFGDLLVALATKPTTPTPRKRSQEGVVGKHGIFFQNNSGVSSSSNASYHDTNKLAASTNIVASGRGSRCGGWILRVGLPAVLDLLAPITLLPKRDRASEPNRHEKEDEDEDGDDGLAAGLSKAVAVRLNDLACALTSGESSCDVVLSSAASSSTSSSSASSSSSSSSSSPREEVFSEAFVEKAEDLLLWTRLCVKTPRTAALLTVNSLLLNSFTCTNKVPVFTF
jgi:hypothetical protein